MNVQKKGKTRQAITITELRSNTREYLDRVAEGEVIQVFRRGKPVAQIVPYPRESRQPHWRRPPEAVSLRGRIRISDVVIEEREKRG